MHLANWNFQLPISSLLLFIRDIKNTSFAYDPDIKQFDYNATEHFETGKLPKWLQQCTTTTKWSAANESNGISMKCISIEWIKRKNAVNKVSLVHEKDYFPHATHTFYFYVSRDSSNQLIENGYFIISLSKANAMIRISIYCNLLYFLQIYEVNLTLNVEIKTGVKFIASIQCDDT